MQILSSLRGLAFASVGVLSLVGCDSLRIDQGVVNTDDPAVFKCSTDSDCLSGYRCLKNVGSSYSVCTAVGAGLNCEQYNLDGDLYLADVEDLPEACFGLRGDCDDEDPNTYPGAPEICDGKDNSCNGAIDDGLDTMPCAKQLGVCQGSNTACVDGAVESCDEPVNGGASIYESHSDLYSVVELCDGVDNNCDGTIDEGCCDASLPITGSNAGANAGCNCQEGQVFACGTDAGTCSRGVRICASADVPAASLPCLELEPVPTADLQTCDPETDVWSEGDTRVCLTERVGIFEDLDDASCASSDAPGCTRSVWRDLAALPGPVACESNSDCDVGAREICAFDNVCRPGNVTPVAEICNGLDDDCDGSVDNHFGTARTSACGECPFNTVKMEYQPASGTTTTWTCVDIYEASRPDADAGSGGSDNSHALAQRGVLPWTGIGASDAQAACEALELRAKLDLDPQNAARVRMVPAKTLCDNDGWAQACSGERAQGSGSNLPHYPYGGNVHQAGMCNDASSSNPLMPTGDNVDCWRPDPANVGMDFADCVDAPDGNCRVFPVDMVGNAMEWTILRSGWGSSNPAPLIRLMGGSYAESADLTCRVNSAHAMTQNAGPTVRTALGVTQCNVDADCPGSAACGTHVNGLKRCYEPCTGDSDCDRGECTPRADLSGTPLGCGLPHFITGDYSGYDDVGFRCCANPLAP